MANEKTSSASSTGDAAAASSGARFLKIGLNVEYLRGVSSAAIQTFNDLQNLPYLIENQPALRYAAPTVVAVIKSLRSELKAAELTKSATAADEFQPMLEAIENVLNDNPDATNATLLDHFADRIVQIAEDVLKTIREEIA